MNADERGAFQKRGSRSKKQQWQRINEKGVSLRGAQATKQSRSKRLLRFARNDTFSSLGCRHHLGEYLFSGMHPRNFGIISISRGKSEGRPEGAKRPPFLRSYKSCFRRREDLSHSFEMTFLRWFILHYPELLSRYNCGMWRVVSVFKRI